MGRSVSQESIFGGRDGKAIEKLAADYHANVHGE